MLNLAYVALLASTQTRTISWLRGVLIAGSICFISFGAIEGITSMIIWNIVIGGLHLARLVRDHATRRSVVLSRSECATRDDLFPEMSDFEFNLLWRLGSEKRFEDTKIIGRGEKPAFVGVILDGVVEIRREGQTFRGLRRGALIGEMSFVSGAPASVEVVAVGQVTMHSWQQQEVKSLEQVHPAAARRFRDYVSENLAAKARL